MQKNNNNTIMKKTILILSVVLFAMQVTKAEKNDTIQNSKFGISFYYNSLINFPKEKIINHYWDGVQTSYTEYKTTFTPEFSLIFNISIYKKLKLNTGLSYLKLNKSQNSIWNNNIESIIYKEKYISIPILMSYNVISSTKFNIIPFLGVYINELFYTGDTYSFNNEAVINHDNYFVYNEAPFLNFEAGFNTDYKLNKNLALSLKLRYIAWDIYSFTKQPTHMDLSNIYTISIGVGIKYYL